MVVVAVARRGDTAADMLRHADAAMYQAKEAGRNRWAGIVPRADVEPTLSIDPLRMGAKHLVKQGVVDRKAGPSAS